MALDCINSWSLHFFLLLLKYDLIACDIDIYALFQILIIITEQLMRRKGVKTSGVSFVFWGLLGITSVLPLYVAAQHKVSFNEVVC